MMYEKVLSILFFTHLLSYTSQDYEDALNGDFCYVNDFTELSSSEGFQSVVKVDINLLDMLLLKEKINNGSPFVVTNVTSGWRAVERWTHSYFKEIFRNEELFSSTFSTPNKPNFCDTEDCAKNVYYGIFLNNHELASSMSQDFKYPPFIEDQWWVKGNEWIHWGHPPCGAKRHMDLTCTSRVSVQVTGHKLWRLYPIAAYDNSMEHKWKQILTPLSVVLDPGDALFWFPGWEHETKITVGLSVSLSLHFLPPNDSDYLHEFSSLLHDAVSTDCGW